MCMQILHMPYLDRFIYFPIYRAFNQDHITRPVCDLNHAIINKKGVFQAKHHIYSPYKSVFIKIYC